MDERTPVRISPHGYPIYEREFNKDIRNTIIREGIDHALSVHDRLDVLMALGGEQYGARITPNSVTAIHRFNNPGMGLSFIEDLIPLMESLGIKFTLTNSVLALQITFHRMRYCAPDLKKMIYRINEVEGSGFKYSTVADIEADPEWTTQEKDQVRAGLIQMNPGNPDQALQDLHNLSSSVFALITELTTRGFKEREPTKTPWG